MPGDDWPKVGSRQYIRITGTATGTDLVTFTLLGRIEVGPTRRGPWRNATPEEAARLRPLLVERARRPS
jgi:hypothetical protein